MKRLALRSEPIFALVLTLVSISGLLAQPTGVGAELLRLQELQRKAHLEENAELLVSIFADEFTSIQRGGIRRPTRGQSRASFQTYFDRSTILVWEDISPPVIRVSDDGSMAYVIVHKRVRLRTMTAMGEVETHTEFAWLETYEKKDGEWKLTSVTSTDRPIE